MGERRGMNHTHLKNRNRGLVLQWIAAEQNISRLDIARQTGLTKMTITNLVGELIEQGYVTERNATATAAVGRNPVMLDIAPHAPKAVGLYISRDTVTVILTDFKLQVLFSRALFLQNETAESLTQKLLTLTEMALSRTKDRVFGIGIAAIGPLDLRNRTMLRPTNFFGIKNFPLADQLEETFGLPVYLQNDMDAAALAEKLFGFGRKLDNFLYIGLSNGVGSGIISNGRVYRGGNGFSGEIGHMSIDYTGPRCLCGNRGCLELYINMPAIRQHLQEAVGEPVGYADFAQLEGHPTCHAIFMDMTEKLVAALVGTVNLLDPQFIFIGHEGIWLPDTYIQLLEDTLNSRILSAGHKHIPVARSAFGTQSPLLGSVCAIYHELFTGHDLLTL